VGEGISEPFQITEAGQVFFGSQAAPTGTGAIEQGGYLDIFRGERTAAGWVTRDMTALGSEPGNKLLIKASSDGRSLLIYTPLTLSPEDVDNPTNNVTKGNDLYMVRETKPPLFVSHGEVPNALPGTQFGAFAAGPFPANSELSAVGFVTHASLQRPEGAESTTEGCYIWSEAGSGLAYLTSPNGPGSSPPQNCRFLAVTGDGRAVIEDTSGDGRTGLIFAAGGAVNFPLTGNTVQLSGPGAATVVALSPDGQTVYLETTDKLLPNADSGADIYAINLNSGAGLSPSSQPKTPAVTCVSCEAGGNPNGASATWIGQSADGTHVLFETPTGVWSWSKSSGASELAPSGDGLEQLVISRNGGYVIATTTAALSPADKDGSSDIYLFQTRDPAPRLITSGDLATHYVPSAVSDGGSRVVYESGEGSSQAIQEWYSGESSSISPLGSIYGYTVMGTAGSELEDVFFEAHEPLVAQDENAGTTDIYDARIDGGFPAPSALRNESHTPNPTAPTPTPYTPDLAPPSLGIPALGPDTSIPSAPSKPKALTKAQELSKVLKVCRKDKKKSKRVACEKAAHKKYAPKKKAKK
jgi:hypothetical protein